MKYYIKIINMDSVDLKSIVNTIQTIKKHEDRRKKYSNRYNSVHPSHQRENSQDLQWKSSLKSHMRNASVDTYGNFASIDLQQRKDMMDQ
jgi:hypothetical protein